MQKDLYNKNVKTKHHFIKEPIICKYKACKFTDTHTVFPPTCFGGQPSLGNNAQNTIKPFLCMHIL